MAASMTEEMDVDGLCLKRQNVINAWEKHFSKEVRLAKEFLFFYDLGADIKALYRHFPDFNGEVRHSSVLAIQKL